MSYCTLCVLIFCLYTHTYTLSYCTLCVLIFHFVSAHTRTLASLVHVCSMGAGTSKSDSPGVSRKVSSLKRKLNDEYFVQKVQLGTGSFGVVHRAIHKPSQEDRAVKSIDKRRLEMKPNFKTHLQREIEIMGECSSHANIVTLFDWFEDESAIHLVLEYCGGGDLGDKILQTRNQLTEKQACEWTYQILLAIAHLHSKKVCHRDIKPENFLISTPSNCLKLSDFGLAIRIDPKKSILRETAGTPAYQAPEIHAGSGYSLPVDLWAAGVTMFVILSGGVNPFVSKDNKLQLSDIRLGVVRFEDLMPTFAHVANVEQKRNMFSLGGRKTSSEESPRRKPHPLSNAESLLRMLLTVDSHKRITAMDALRHPWFVQHGLAEAVKVVAPKPDVAAPETYVDECESLEASPPTMEPILAQRDAASSFDLNISEVSDGASKMPTYGATIGPGGGKEGKVIRCDKCGAFFYSQRGQAVACPECRVSLGYLLPADGVQIGTLSFYTEKSGWVGSRITKFNDQTGEFVMDNGVKVNAVAPPGRETGQGAPWSKGTSVVYLSGTYGTWLPAVIEGFNQQTRQYDLDVKCGVNADKIRARVKRLTK